MANQKSLPLYEKCWFKHNFRRATDILILLLLLLLLAYRVISVNNYSFPWFVALLCESWFTFSWVLTVSTRWTPAIIKTYSNRLLQRYLIINIPSHQQQLFQYNASLLRTYYYYMVILPLSLLVMHAFVAHYEWDYN